MCLCHFFGERVSTTGVASIRAWCFPADVFFPFLVDALYFPRCSVPPSPSFLAAGLRSRSAGSGSRSKNVSALIAVGSTDGGAPSFPAAFTFVGGAFTAVLKLVGVLPFLLVPSLMALTLQPKKPPIRNQLHQVLIPSMPLFTPLLLEMMQRQER